MKTRTLFLLIPLLVCVGFIPVIGIFIVIGIILYLAYKEIGSSSVCKTLTHKQYNKINMIDDTVLEAGR